MDSQNGGNGNGMIELEEFSAMMINCLYLSISKRSKSREDELKLYLSKISDEALYAYNVYQIEGEGRNLFVSIKGDENTIMGLPIKKIKEYLKVHGY